MVIHCIMPCRNGFLLLAFNLFYSVRGRFITTSLLLKNCYSEIPLPPSSLWLPTLIGSIGSIFLCRARRNAKDNNHHMAPRDWQLSCVYGSLPNKTSPIIFRNNSWNEVYWTLTFEIQSLRCCCLNHGSERAVSIFQIRKTRPNPPCSSWSISK